MSYILDALRKSEQERQRGKVPDFHTPPASVSDESSKRPNLWAMVAIGVVLVNIVLAVVFWNRLVPDSSESVVTPVTAETGAPDSAINEEPIAVAQPQVAAPSVQPPQASKPAKVPPDAPAKKPEFTEAYDVADEQSEPSYETIHPQNSKADQEAESNQDMDSYEPQMAYVPQIEELPSYDRQNIPDMTFSSHMYSSIPKYRSVIINGKRLKEGQRYNGDIVVREITESGVVMSQGSVLFQVDVLGRWAQ